MSKFNVNDELWIKGKVIFVDELINHDNEFSYKVKTEDGQEIWFDEDILHATPTNAKNAQVESKWIEIEDDNNFKWLINIDNISALVGRCIVLNGNHGDNHGLVHLKIEDFDKLKEKLLCLN